MKRILSTLLLALSCGIASEAQNEHTFEVSKNLDIFNTVYRELDMFYVDTLDAKSTILQGIDAMLGNLDPYTEYYPEEDMGDLKMMTTGKYGGIGSIIRMRKDSTVIIGEPYEGMPAAEVGLKVGDILLKIDNQDLKGKAVSDVSNLLRGEPGTTFILKVQRPGEKKPREFKITRQSIKMPAIPYYGLLTDKATGKNSSVGYINLTQFIEGCAKDVRRAIISLKEKGAKSFVLDLRGNGGGLLNEAVDIVNLFVPKGLDIVQTKGKVKSANRTYTTSAEPLDTEIPLVVLVNSNTASAAEIVSGSLQDLDRAVVVGTKTFGKGLVQSTRELPYNASFKLTTAKYYIPSGRCIQAVDYKKEREKRDGKKTETTATDSLSHIFHTAGGREVRDGKGISPDVEMKHDTLSNMVFYLSNDDVLTDWGTKYMQKHTALPAVKDFKIADEDISDLLEMAKDSKFKYDRMSSKRLEDLKKTAIFEGYYEDAKAEFEALEKKLEHNMERDFEINKRDIRRIMGHEIVKRYAFQAGQVEMSIKDDEDVDKAVEILSNSAEYNKILGK